MGVKFKLNVCKRLSCGFGVGGVDKWLSWLSALKGHYLQVGMTSRNAVQGLHRGTSKNDILGCEMNDKLHKAILTMVLNGYLRGHYMFQAARPALIFLIEAVVL